MTTFFELAQQMTPINKRYLTHLLGQVKVIFYIIITDYNRNIFCTINNITFEMRDILIHVVRGGGCYAVRSISDPLEHLVNQVEIRHRPSYLAN